ncbi:unnamed protein product [Prunus armeniaca]
MSLPVLSQRSEFQSTRGIHKVTDLCMKEVAGEPNNRGDDGFIGDSPFERRAKVLSIGKGFTIALQYSGVGVKKIMGDVKPFTEVKSYFADAKFYMDEDMVTEVIPVEVHSTSKAIPRRDEHSKCLSTEENGDKKSKSTSFGQMGSSPIDSQ